MKRTPLAAFALVLTALPASAQAPKITGLLQIWYTQMLDNNLRLNSTSVTPNKYYNLRSEFQENSFAVRRTELKFSGKIWGEEGKSLDYEVMIDPSINTNTANAANSNASYNPTILQDAALHLKLNGGLEFKLGQFKNLQTYEGIMSSSELMFAERAQMTRTFGDKRDRGAMASYAFGDPKAFSTKLVVGAFNGMNDRAAGKVNDSNAQKDLVARVEFTAAKAHKFGFYTLQGTTDQSDKSTLAAKTFNGLAVTPASTSEILGYKDKTSNYGAYYVYQDATWTFMAEAMTGLLGRRNASVGTAGTASRQRLDQNFLGYYAAGAYTTGRNTFALRFDTMNYNQKDEWYTVYNPYTNANATTSLGADYSPKYTEATLGWTYALKPASVKAAHLKLNYVARSKNFLKPRAGQTGEQGGDTLMVAFQIAF